MRDLREYLDEFKEQRRVRRHIREVLSEDNDNFW